MKMYTANGYPLSRHTWLYRMVQCKRDTRQSGKGNVNERVILAVADARDEDPLELPSLYSVIDPDALAKLFDHSSPAGRNGPGRVVFTLAGCEVVVHSDGEVDVTAPGDQSSVSVSADHADRQNKSETTLD